MPERDGYIPGVPCWIDTSQPDPEAAVDFYRGLFGWEFEDVMPPDSPGKYFIARIRGGDVAAVGSIPEAAPPLAMWNTYVWVESADDAAAKAKEAGGSAVMEPFDVMDAGRMAVLMDPEGAVFCAWQAKEHKGARIVNEHGSLNFNGLNTRDPEGAKSFYGSVFGWETLALGGAEMWVLPGYGDFLELSELMCRDALDREESCGGHFRVEYQTPDGEALLNDQDFAYVSAWEYMGPNQEPQLHKEPLDFEYVHLAQRSYK